MSDDLEERKQETWGMDEVRSQAGGSAESEDTSDTADSADTEESEETTATAESQEEEAAATNAETDDTPVTAAGDTVRELAVDADRKDLAVRDLHNVNVYLYEPIYREMVATFKDLDAEYFQVHGDDLAKNKEFFNAVFRAGLESPQLREELGLGSED